ncbi:MAG: hypothetical protein IEMM0002_0868 [bacterium]|nr:MAG: hypothetical protein IEMM0002_0868 [bacterium]
MKISSIYGATSGRQAAFTSGFKFIGRNVPTVELTNASPLNALNAQNSEADLDRSRKAHPLTEKVNFGIRFLSVQESRFSQVSDLLVSLRLNTALLRKPETYNIRSASSDSADVADADADRDAVLGRYEINVVRIARAHEIGSYVADEPSAALGLSGSFKINGRSVDVEASDSIFTLRDKINYGEDENRNGALDGPEDINGNGALDTLTAPGVYTQEGYIPPFFYSEDLNGNSVLDGTEDANGNLRLDGGGAEIGVRAVVAGNQLVLISDHTADIELRFKDPDRILERLGFIFRNDSTGLTATNKLNDQTVEPQKAVGDVDGEPFIETGNKVDDAIAGVTLNLKKSGSFEVTVQNDPNLGIIPIIRFAMNFNLALRLLNSTIESGGALSKNRRIQSIQSDMVRSFYTAPAEPFGKLKSVADAGISANESEPTAIKQPAFERLPQHENDRLSLPGSGKYSFSSQSERIGVNSPDNFNIRLDGRRMSSALEENSAAVGELLGFAAGRLQKRLDVHIQPEYGTIRLQQNLIEFYKLNQREVDNNIQRILGITGSKIDTITGKNIFRSIA